MFIELSVQTMSTHATDNYGNTSPSSVSSSASASPVGFPIDGPLYPGMRPEDIKLWLQYHSHVLYIAHTTPPPSFPPQTHLHYDADAPNEHAYSYEPVCDNSLSVPGSVVDPHTSTAPYLPFATPTIPPGLLYDPTPAEEAINHYVDIAWRQPESGFHRSSSEVSPPC